MRYLVAGMVGTLVMAGVAKAHVIEPPAQPAELGEPDVRELDGPTAASDMNLVPGGEFALEDGPAALPGHKMRVRFFEVAPGGVIPQHSHDGRPAIAVVVDGEMTEHRSDDVEPHVHGPGGVSLEPHGLVHWWENTGDAPAVIVGYDVYKAE